MAEERFRKYDFTNDKSWLNYFNNLEIADGNYMSNTTLEKYKRRWYNKNVEPISMEVGGGASSSANTGNSSSSEPSSQQASSSSANHTTTGSRTSDTTNTASTSGSTSSNTSTTGSGSFWNVLQQQKPYIYTAACSAIIICGILGLISILFCPTCGAQTAATPPPISNSQFDRELDIDDTVIPPQPQTIPASSSAPSISPFMSLCMSSYFMSVLLSCGIFAFEFLHKYGWKKYAYIMFDADGQYLFISLFYLVSGKSGVFILLLMLSALVRLLPNLLIVTNNNPRVLAFQQKLYQYDLGDKFARFELFLLVNEVLAFSILKIIMIINFICHRYIIFPHLANYIHAIKNALDQYMPNMLRGVYTKICGYLSMYVASLQQKKAQLDAQH
ncbi:hypothetical protein C9374_014115 [Naegleria lovaniensis]|uniref:Uncharacterized protein n=1 Tax=Naegleria lovaniensis TaxID=51637 RepID=A0AA88GV90_NAELO|nr:uncharacterized protein C9374_014115 [Naegleria lovaniensis]KAG2389555.1 hypothetical protein C9374_014115 [Naegleria lovaniensis]